ncbi:hypothetical protein J9N36_003228 [Salmonella enterica]|nr:hypothetical protein [Salmonella enterica]
MTTLAAVPALVPSDEGTSISSCLNNPVLEDGNGSPVSQNGETSVADATTTADISSQQPINRMDNNGDRRAEPTSQKKLLVLVWQISVIVLILGLVIMVAYLWQTVSQQAILLTSLDTTFRSGRLESLSQRIMTLEEQQQQYQPTEQAQIWREEDGLARESMKTRFTQLTKDIESIQSDVMELTTQQNTLKQLTDTVSSQLGEQVSRIDMLSAWKTQREDKVTSTTVKSSPVRTQDKPATLSPAVKKPSIPRIFSPPFVLASVDRRGGRSYAVVLPVGASSDWSQMQMLSPGESYRGWMLVNTDGHRASFQINGRIQQLTP